VVVVDGDEYCTGCMSRADIVASGNGCVTASAGGDAGDGGKTNVLAVVVVTLWFQWFGAPDSGPWCVSMTLSTSSADWSKE
jgi:hypothetical protein